MATDPGRIVKLHAGDETYTLYAGNRALRMIERETERPLLETLGSLATLESVEFNLLTTIVWALLQQFHPNTTIDDVDEIIDAGGGWQGVMDAVGEAIMRGFPTTTPDSGKARSRGTGTRSSPAASPRV